MAIIYTPEALQEAQQEFRDFFGVEPIPTEDPAHLRRRIKQGKLDAETNADLEFARDEFRRTFGVEPNLTEDAAHLRRRTSAGETGRGPLTELHILTAREHQWYYDYDTKTWYVEYGLPNSDRSLLFEATTEQVNALLGEGRTPTAKSADFAELLRQPGITFGGNISEIEGEGSFEDEVLRVTTLALDEGRLPDWAMGTPEIMDAIFVAQSEDKSDEWLLEQIAKTDSFKQRFPGIMKLKDDGNLSLAESVTGFLEYEAGVELALKAAGMSGAATPEMIGGLLNKGHSLTVINDTVKGYKRMKTYAPALEAFNSILAESGMDTITSIQDMLDFVSGRSSAAVYDLYEASSIQEAAVGAGLGDIFSTQDAIDIAGATDQTLETATAGMRKAAEMMLRLRHEIDLGKFDLDHEELIDINLGRVPRSGRSETEIMENINRAVLSAQGTLKARAKPFTAFGASGTPQAASLRAARQES